MYHIPVLQKFIVVSYLWCYVQNTLWTKLEPTEHIISRLTLISTVYNRWLSTNFSEAIMQYAQHKHITSSHTCEKNVQRMKKMSFHFPIYCRWCLQWCSWCLIVCNHIVGSPKQSSRRATTKPVNNNNKESKKRREVIFVCDNSNILWGLIAATFISAFRKICVQDISSFRSFLLLVSDEFSDLAV